MTDRVWPLYSLRSLFVVMIAIALPFGLATVWTGVSALLLCGAIAATLLATTRRRIFGIALLAYVVAMPISCVRAVYELSVTGPYVRAYNERLEKRAEEAGLVGSSEECVEILLGPATFVYNGWNSTNMETGEPTPDAEYWTTYNYAPYWFFPAAKFEVHCRDGIVQSTEMYDY